MITAKRAAKLVALGNPHRRKSLERVIAQWAAKAPVDIPGAQRAAHALEAEIERRQVPIPSEVRTARAHALEGEGREEFDQAVARWRNRGFAYLGGGTGG